MKHRMYESILSSAKFCSTSRLVLSYTVLMSSNKSEKAVQSCFLARMEPFIWSRATLNIVFYFLFKKKKKKKSSIRFYSLFQLVSVAG